jgi:Concanavalin A-like lectin/glucanases superfamily
MVAITDKFGKSSITNNYAIATTVKTTRTIGVTVLEAYDLSKFPDDTPAFFVTYKKTTDPLTGIVSVTNLVSWKALVNTGANTLTNLTVAPGYADIGNDVGDFIELIPTSYWGNSLIGGILDHANADGTLKTSAVKAALGITTDPGGGWAVLNNGTAPTVASAANKGNKEFDLTFAGVDLSSVLSPGMRFKVERTGTTPTQCTDLESSSSQYWSKSSPTGITFTDDFTCEAWVNVESYSQGYVITRFDLANGFLFGVNANGQVNIDGRNAGNYKQYASYRSIPLNTWTHIAATLDMSGSAATIYINGELVASYLNASGGSPTSIVQGGNLQIGAYNGATGLYDGKVAQARVWSTIRTATQIRDNMAIQTVGNEVGLVADFKLNGASTDSTSNANNLTAFNSAGYVTDNPFKSTEYALIHKVSYAASNTTVTVFTGTDHTIPNMTLQNPYYSTQDTPYNFPRSKGKWKVVCLLPINLQTAIGAFGQWFDAPVAMYLPTGEFKLGVQGTFQINGSATATIDGWMGIGLPGVNEVIDDTSGRLQSQPAVNYADTFIHAETDVSNPSQTAYCVKTFVGGAGGAVSTWLLGDSALGGGSSFKLYAYSQYI